jgi:3-hydroxymyristoyl/3-hydroxydecanoyl-(acyl carrier protein) dehydratase
MKPDSTKTDLSLPIPAEMLIPHQAPLRMVDRLIQFDRDGQTGVVESVVLSDNVLVGDNGFLDPVAMVELIAQSYAVLLGYEYLLRGRRMQQGYLVGIRHIQFCGRAFKGDRLRIAVKTLKAMEEFAVARGEVVCKGQTIGFGTIKTWCPRGN